MRLPKVGGNRSALSVTRSSGRAGHEVIDGANQPARAQSVSFVHSPSDWGPSTSGSQEA